MTSAEKSQTLHEGERLVEIRTAPSYPAFIALGVVLGLVVAFLVTLFGPESESYTFGAVLGVMAVIFGGLGAAVGAIVAIIIDRVGVKRAKIARAVPTDE